MQTRSLCGLKGSRRGKSFDMTSGHGKTAVEYSECTKKGEHHYGSRTKRKNNPCPAAALGYR